MAALLEMANVARISFFKPFVEKKEAMFNVKKRKFAHSVVNVKEIAADGSEELIIQRIKAHNDEDTVCQASSPINKKLSATLTRPLIQPKVFQDGSMAVAYKEQNPVICKLIQHWNHKKKRDSQSKVVEANCAQDNKPYTGWQLIKRAERKWVIYDHAHHLPFYPEAGKRYIFVTMPDDTIRIAPEGKSAHSRLSSCAQYVKYAGEIEFDAEHQIHSWNNQSGAYCPTPSLAHQAGFGDGLSRFESKYDRNDAVRSCSLSL